MIPLKQKNDYSCWGTAIASVLDDPADFPHEREGLSTQEAHDRWGDHHCEVSNYLKDRFDLYLLLLQRVDKSGAWNFRGLHLISGMSPRGRLHTVVGHKGEIIHDPWPGDDGGLTDDQPWEYELFVSLMGAFKRPEVGF